MVRPALILLLIHLLLCGCVPKQSEPEKDPATKPAQDLADTEHPPLIAKLRYIQDQTLPWLLKTGFLGQNGALPIKYVDANSDRNNAGAANPVLPGETFFADGPAQGRFKYLGAINRWELNPAINVEEDIVIARIEDQKPNKAGKVYEIPAPLKASQRAKHIQYDRSAVMVLEALGEGGREMVIEENTRFSLPAGQDKKPYLLKSVSPEQVVIEYPGPDGQRSEVTIGKGSLPTLNQ